MKTASEQLRIVDQIKSKLNEKERYERDIKRAHETMSRNSKDVVAQRDLERAESLIERLESDIERLVNQLGY